MSLVYNEFEGSDKTGANEELKMEKMVINSKKTRKKSEHVNESIKKEDNKNKEMANNIKDKEIYDTSMEGIEIPILNNNINNGSLMLTELLDIDNNNKIDLSNINNITEEKIKNEINNSNVNNNNSFLKKKLENIKIPKNLKNEITSRITKSHDELHDEFKNDLLNISNKKTSVNEILALNKSNNNIFLTSVDKISKENMKKLKTLKKEEESIKKNIEKINMNKELIENGLSLKNNIIDENIRKNQLKNMNNLKENFVIRLIKINQKIELILNEEKLAQKAKLKKDYQNLDDSQEEYNLHLKKLKEQQNINKTKFEQDTKQSLEKHQKFCDQLELEKSGKKLSLIKERKEKERELILKRKKLADEILEKSKIHLNEKFTKKENDYRYFQLKEKFENNEKKLIDKVNLIKKDPLVTKEELKELSKKIFAQKKILIEDAEDKKKQLMKLWSYRSQTLPAYKHPLTIRLEEELIQNAQKDEENKKKKECNDLEKRNYKPPKVSPNEKLKNLREIRKNKIDRESVILTELNNKKRTDKFKFAPIPSPKNLKIIKDELEHELNNLVEFDIKSMIHKKKKKILKPIKIIHEKPNKPIDYLAQMILNKENNKNIQKSEHKENREKIKNIMENEEKNGNNIIDTIKMVKAQSENIDNKVQQKKQMLKLNGGYLNNPKLGDEVGDLLVESIQAKLNIINKLNGE